MPFFAELDAHNLADRKRWRLAEASLHLVILGRSKERSDAAQTLGSMPLRQPKNAAAQNGACIRDAPATLRS
ncbi:MAG: hypothetical protein EOQ86_32195 [Mesorhizobium sp.]|nr:MAG: hypothetical protein EOQ85_33985 [Mesorhizobium sp.]RWH74881.1 MAG: hypothetical protein EOQ86_32195 [Mesorhizobium sp.]RWH89297.1 MAG: hypothetical protein EOQ87_18620 [Mesorhizobium sp.]RWH90634.1 MAG: hypothetical protein EOQ88_33500 [Mesorhizobium sp.]RWI01377.1 MAG: hypothetical protein EOQ89_17170 [Mesorhizobium sp.]